MRYYGGYSARTRGAQKSAACLLAATQQASNPQLQRECLAETLDELADESRKPVSKQWAIWIKKVYEVNPLVCPKCGGQMKIVAFIHDAKVIKDIAASLGLQAWRAPPKINKQQTSGICYEQSLD